MLKLKLMCLLLLFIVLGVVGALEAQFVSSDPGPRPGPAGAGGALPGLTPSQMDFFNHGADQFAEDQSVKGTEPAHDGFPAATGAGLGPRFNMTSCGGCHAQPALGGTSPAPGSPQAAAGPNPQVAAATRFGATNTVPFFITANGPVREARFKFNSDGTRDGGVHALFTIAGRQDAPGCTNSFISQPDFNTAAANNNLIFRIPTPTFGLGLVEAINENDIVTSHNATAQSRAQFGIGGILNRSGNDGRITKFGWKAQNPSLMVFAGEAYNVEQGVTNELFPMERSLVEECLFNGVPEDQTHFDATVPSQVPSDVAAFEFFMRFLAPPTPSTTTPGGSASIARGRALFTSNATGCYLCHTPSLPVKSPVENPQGSSNAAINAQGQANLFSDLFLHEMGPGLADNIVQGNSGPSRFRTAPLWGLGQRIFFLHDGRTRDLKQAIQAHRSFSNGVFPDSAANASIDAFNRLSESQKQDILNFLRSL